MDVPPNHERWIWSSQPPKPNSLNVVLFKLRILRFIRVIKAIVQQAWHWCRNSQCSQLLVHMSKSNQPKSNQHVSDSCIPHCYSSLWSWLKVGIILPPPHFLKSLALSLSWSLRVWSSHILTTVQRCNHTCQHRLRFKISFIDYTAQPATIGTAHTLLCNRGNVTHRYT